MFTHPLRQAILPVVTKVAAATGSPSTVDDVPLPAQEPHALYPVNRVYCVGQNYAAHAREMGAKPRSPVRGAAPPSNPFFFMKPPMCIKTPDIPADVLPPTLRAIPQKQDLVELLNTIAEPESAADTSGGTPAPRPADFAYPVDARCRVRYPSMTESYHYEAELVVAIGAPPREVAERHVETSPATNNGHPGGFQGIAVEDAHHYIYGYGIGLDMTRRDLQAAAKASGRPWDLAKGAEESVVLSPLVSAAALRAAAAADPALLRLFTPTEEALGSYQALCERVKNCNGVHDDVCAHQAFALSPDNVMLKQGAITLDVNGAEHQRGDLSDMLNNVSELIAVLSSYVALRPGDIIFTGTPAGVGAVRPGDVMRARIDGIGCLEAEVV